jgi:charged multivesicular body protein 5
LGERGKVIQVKVDDCNKELLNIKNQMKTAKGMAYKSLQQKALAVLRRRKMYDMQLGNLLNQQFNIDQVQFTSETIQSTIETVSVALSFLFCKPNSRI